MFQVVTKEYMQVGIKMAKAGKVFKKGRNSHRWNYHKTSRTLQVKKGGKWTNVRGSNQKWKNRK